MYKIFGAVIALGATLNGGAFLTMEKLSSVSDAFL